MLVWFLVSSFGPTGATRKTHPLTSSSLSARLIACCRDRTRKVVEKVEQHLLTPFGLRTLAPSDPRYRRSYTGTPSERDGAYHRGTVWPWLLGPFITAYIKVNGGREEARRQAPSASLAVSFRVSPDGSRIGSCLGDLRRGCASSPLRVYRSGLERGRDSTRLF
jgi:hypothetical protein